MHSFVTKSKQIYKLLSQINFQASSIYAVPNYFTFIPRHFIIPIVMGARPEDYQRAAPFNSFIHVDQFSGPKELAEFLLELDKNDEKYNEYFQVTMIEGKHY